MRAGARGRGGAHRHPAQQDLARNGAVPVRTPRARAVRRGRRARPQRHLAALDVAQEHHRRGRGALFPSEFRQARRALFFRPRALRGRAHRVHHVERRRATNQRRFRADQHRFQAPAPRGHRFRRRLDPRQRRDPHDPRLAEFDDDLGGRRDRLRIRVHVRGAGREHHLGGRTPGNPTLHRRRDRGTPEGRDDQDGYSLGAANAGRRSDAAKRASARRSPTAAR